MPALDAGILFAKEKMTGSSPVKMRGREVQLVDKVN
jgi:hypothetical protein